MKKIAVITRAAGVPHVLRTYVNAKPDDVDLTVVVQGDVTEARWLVEELGGVYLDEDSDSDLVDRWRSSTYADLVYGQCHLALLHALTLGVDYVISVDADHSVPLDPLNFYQDVISGFESPHVLVSSDTGWFDPGLMLVPAVTRRGLPLTERFTHPQFTQREPDPDSRIGVVAGLTLGDPDVDAVERIVNRPQVRGTISGFDLTLGITLDQGTWAPFGKLNTAYRWEVAPLFGSLPGERERYGDVWAAYLAQVIMDALGYHVRHSAPVVNRQRDHLDLVRDLRGELDGYQHTPEFVRRLRTIAGELRELDLPPVEMLRTAHQLLKTDNSMLHAWLEDVDEAVAEGEKNRSTTSG